MIGTSASSGEMKKILEKLDEVQKKVENDPTKILTVSFTLAQRDITDLKNQSFEGNDNIKEIRTDRIRNAAEKFYSKLDSKESISAAWDLVQELISKILNDHGKSREDVLLELGRGDDFLKPITYICDNYPVCKQIRYELNYIRIIRDRVVEHCRSEFRDNPTEVEEIQKDKIRTIEEMVGLIIRWYVKKYQASK